MALLKELKINPKYVGTILGVYITIWLVALYGYTIGNERFEMAAMEFQTIKQQTVSEQAVLDSRAYNLLSELPGEVNTEVLQQIVLNHSNSYAFQVIRLETLNEVSKDSQKHNSVGVILELRGDLKEYLLFTDDLKKKYPLLQIKPRSLNIKNGQLHIICVLTA